MQKTKKIIYTLIAYLIILSSSIVYAEAEPSLYESSNEQDTKGNVTYAQEVTTEMTDPSYWSNKLGEEANKLLLTPDEIKQVNNDIIIGRGTFVFDITDINETITQARRKTNLVNAVQNTFDYFNNHASELYVNGELINDVEYKEMMQEAIQETGFENDDEPAQFYAVAIKRTPLKSLPTNAIWGYDGPDDPDDESCDSAVEVNEPFVINAKCVIGEDTFYWGNTYNCTGWVDAKDVAIFDSREDWLEAWQVDVAGKDFLVVTQDNITLEPSTSSPETSEVQLKIGTVLKLVPKNEIPESVNDRKPYNNYVVYLPTRDENGKYVRSYALIAEHYNVSIGYLPLTQKNVLNVAFTCLGNRYGWGGMIGAMDCTLYTKSIYKCFGIELPRNTTYQPKVPERVKLIENMTEEEKEAYIERLPVGTILFFSGHAMVYIGSENGKNYVISDTGSLSDSYGDLDVRRMYSVIINPLTARRSGTRGTWLKNVTKALIFGDIPSEDPEEQPEEVGEEDVYVTVDPEAQKENVVYPDGITKDMTIAEYWKDLLEEKNKELLTTEEIGELNKEINGEDSNKADLTSKEILIVAQDRIVLEPSLLQPEISEVELPLGTVLELVPEDQIPKNIAERGPWNNYVVYLPVKNENGEIEKKYALIQEHYQVNIGYLSFTPENIIEISFRCLGDSNELMDNTTFITNIYKCFGLDLPKDLNITDKIKDISKMSQEEKAGYFDTLPVGSLLKLGEEYSIYLGKKDDNYYGITSTKGDTNSIILSKIDIKDITSVVDFTQEKSEEPDEEEPTVTQYEITEGNNQTVEQGREAEFKINAEYSKFVDVGKVFVDKQELSKNQFDSREGSTVITLKDEYTETLAEGEHELKVAFVDGEANGKFTVEKKTEDNKEVETETKKEKTNNPETGDDIVLWVSLMIVSSAGLVSIKKKF